MIDTLKTWLQTFPGWPDAPFLTDTTNPDSLGLFSRGVEVVSDRVDILGRHQVKYRLSLELGRVCPGSAQAAAWLLQLQNWALEQSARGLAPKLGEDPQRIYLEKGTLRSPRGRGSALYTAQLTAEFTKTYEETEHVET